MRCYRLAFALAFVALFLSCNTLWAENKVSKPDHRILNNFVTELLTLEKFPAKPVQEWSFTNPREGWVFVAITVPEDAFWPRVTFTISIDGGRPVIVHRTGSDRSTKETMRFLTAGEYKLRLSYRPETPAKPALNTLPISRIVVRAVPELQYWAFPAASIAGYGMYDLDFLRKDVLPNVNVLVGVGSGDYEPVHRWWKERGGQFFEEKILPTHARRQDKSIPHPLTTDCVYDYWTKTAGFQNPLLAGCTGDEWGEYNEHTRQDYPAYIGAIKRLANEQSFKGKSILGAWSFGHDPNTKLQPPRQFLQAFFSLGYKMAWEVYLRPGHTEAESWEYIRADKHKNSMGKRLKEWEAVFPGCIKKGVVFLLGINSAPPFTQDVDPHVDFRVFMDMQLNYLANTPGARGIYGLGVYKSRYADEEVVRWSGRLFRHYAIEGKKDMLSKQYGFTYTLNYIQNGDFDDGLKGWTVSKAVPSSVKTGSAKELGSVLGRWAAGQRGDNYLQLERCGNKPNTVSQIIRNLKSGKTYALDLIVADQNIVTKGKSDKQKLAFSVSIPNGMRIEPKCFVSTVQGHTTFSAHKDKPRPWYNYHSLVFRAKGPTAKLVLSDWADKKNPGGPIGQKLLINCIEVRPYLEYE